MHGSYYKLKNKESDFNLRFENKSALRLLFPLILTACLSSTLAAAPMIGFVFPAGGQKGTVLQIAVYGQQLSNPKAAYVSGKGVHVKVDGYESSEGPLNFKQKLELERRIVEISKQRAQAKNPSSTPSTTTDTEPEEPVETVGLPDIPDLRDLDKQTPQRLNKVLNKYYYAPKRPSGPLGEKVSLTVTIDPDAPIGEREIRIRTTHGLSNPLVLNVSSIAEVREPDIADIEPTTLPSLQTPVVLNGQILEGEEDRFKLKLRGGQRLLIAAQARGLMPYLADAVPGWFQAVISLHNDKGKEIAFNDDNSFDPDPLLSCMVPFDGEYTLKVRDSIFRGRWDFVYRLYVADQAAIKSLFPAGSRTKVSLAPSGKPVKLLIANPWSPLDEVEPNDTSAGSQSITLERVVSGNISRPGDTDVYRFNGKAGDQVVAEIYARRMGSPMDSYIKLTDSSFKVIASNDDNKVLNTGFNTHQADSYLSTALPATGAYYLYVSDVQRHEGNAYGYVLRIGPPQPDFALFASPSNISIPSWGPAAITVNAIRSDGWNGDIEIVLKEPTTGFKLGGAKIPAGADSAKVTVSAQGINPGDIRILKMEGRAVVGKQTIIRSVTPSNEMMQAFAYKHLVPAQEMIATVYDGKN